VRIKREGEGEEERRRVGTFTLFTHKKNHKVIFSLLTNKFFDYLNSDWVMKFTG